MKHNVPEDFGVIVCCYYGDYRLAKGCCASIRHFLGEVPICLIVDGDLSVRSLERAYGVHVIKRKDIRNQDLKGSNVGWGFPKMTAFWESPWKNFLYLDADIVGWGDLLQFANFEDFDMIVDSTAGEHLGESVVNSLYVNTKTISSYFPDFRWQDQSYFCTGAFFAKRDLFSLDEYLELLELRARNPYLFCCGEQGLLNLMVARASKEGRLRVGNAPFQKLVVDYYLNCEKNEMVDRFRVDKILGSVLRTDEGCVLHYAGLKPRLSDTKVYSAPMVHFRRKFYLDLGLSEQVAGTMLYLEELADIPKTFYWRAKRRLQYSLLDWKMKMEGMYNQNKHGDSAP